MVGTYLWDVESGAKKWGFWGDYEGCGRGQVVVIFGQKIWPVVTFILTRREKLEKKVDKWPKKVGKWPFLKTKVATKFVSKDGRNGLR